MPEERVKCTGQQGSWFATVDKTLEKYGIKAGKRLPCVHSRFWVKGKKPEHKEKFLNPDHPYGGPKYQEYFDAIKEGFVILTNSDWKEEKDGQLHARRTGYVAIYEVSNVRDENGILEWNYIKRIADCE